MQSGTNHRRETNHKLEGPHNHREGAPQAWGGGRTYTRKMSLHNIWLSEAEERASELFIYLFQSGLTLGTLKISRLGSKRGRKRYEIEA